MRQHPNSFWSVEMIKLQRREVTVKIDQLLIMSSQTVGSEVIDTILARNEWRWLGSKMRYADWFKARVEEGGFIEGVDYITFHKKMKRGENNNLATNLIEHHISIDMAKHLGMMERNEKGKEVRKYFIQCEKEAKQKIISNPFSFVELGNDMGQVDVSIRRNQKVTRRRLMYVLARRLCCGRPWIQRLTNEIYKILLGCPYATARNFREHMNLPQISAVYLTRDQLAGHIQILVSGIEQTMLILFSANQDITFGELRNYALEQAKISHKQLLRIVQQPPSELVFGHEYNIVPILPYRGCRMQRSMTN